MLNILHGDIHKKKVALGQTQPHPDLIRFATITFDWTGGIATISEDFGILPSFRIGSIHHRQNDLISSISYFI